MPPSRPLPMGRARSQAGEFCQPFVLSASPGRVAGSGCSGIVEIVQAQFLCHAIERTGELLAPCLRRSAQFGCDFAPLFPQAAAVHQGALIGIEPAAHLLQQLTPRQHAARRRLSARPVPVLALDRLQAANVAAGSSLVPQARRELDIIRNPPSPPPDR